MNLKMKMLCAASLFCIGVSAYATDVQGEGGKCTVGGFGPLNPSVLSQIRTKDGCEMKGGVWVPDPQPGDAGVPDPSKPNKKRVIRPEVRERIQQEQLK